MSSSSNFPSHSNQESSLLSSLVSLPKNLQEKDIWGVKGDDLRVMKLSKWGRFWNWARERVTGHWKKTEVARHYIMALETCNKEMDGKEWRREKKISVGEKEQSVTKIWEDAIQGLEAFGKNLSDHPRCPEPMKKMMQTQIDAMELKFVKLQIANCERDYPTGEVPKFLTGLKQKMPERFDSAALEFISQEGGAGLSEGTLKFLVSMILNPILDPKLKEFNNVGSSMKYKHVREVVAQIPQEVKEGLTKTSKIQSKLLKEELRSYTGSNEKSFLRICLMHELLLENIPHEERGKYELEFLQFLLKPGIFKDEYVSSMLANKLKHEIDQLKKANRQLEISSSGSMQDDLKDLEILRSRISLIEGISKEINENEKSIVQYENQIAINDLREVLEKFQPELTKITENFLSKQNKRMSLLASRTDKTHYPNANYSTILAYDAYDPVAEEVLCNFSKETREFLMDHGESWLPMIQQEMQDYIKFINDNPSLDGAEEKFIKFHAKYLVLFKDEKIRGIFLQFFVDVEKRLLLNFKRQLEDGKITTEEVPRFIVYCFYDLKRNMGGEDRNFEEFNRFLLEECQIFEVNDKKEVVLGKHWKNFLQRDYESHELSDVLKSASFREFFKNNRCVSMSDEFNRAFLFGKLSISDIPNEFIYQKYCKNAVETAAESVNDAPLDGIINNIDACQSILKQKIEKSEGDERKKYINLAVALLKKNFPSTSYLSELLKSKDIAEEIYDQFYANYSGFSVPIDPQNWPGITRDRFAKIVKNLPENTKIRFSTEKLDWGDLGDIKFRSTEGSVDFNSSLLKRVFPGFESKFSYTAEDGKKVYAVHPEVASFILDLQDQSFMYSLENFDQWAKEKGIDYALKFLDFAEGIGRPIPYTKLFIEKHIKENYITPEVLSFMEDNNIVINPLILKIDLQAMDFKTLCEKLESLSFLQNVEVHVFGPSTLPLAKTREALRSFLQKATHLKTLKIISGEHQNKKRVNLSDLFGHIIFQGAWHHTDNFEKKGKDYEFTFTRKVEVEIK